jgi:GxxExxY protein
MNADFLIEKNIHVVSGVTDGKPQCVQNSGMGKRPNPGGSKLLHHELTEKIIGSFYAVYNDLGVGFVESVYENAITVSLAEAGLKVGRQVPIAVWYRGVQVGEFRADLVVNDVVLLELKVAKAIDFAFEKQLLNYLRATNIEVGLILNFGPSPQFRRFVFENPKKEIRVHPRESALKGF